MKVPITEIWNVESIESTLRQIAFYRDSGSFKSQSEVKLVFSKVEQLINHIEKQADHGLKFPVGQEPTPHCSEYRMYENELILGDNTVMAELNGKRVSFLNYGVLYILSTTDERFNNAMYENLDNLVKKSTMISKSGEKPRLRFFNQLREKIYQYGGR
jgi:hypothetical protein